MRHSHSRLLVLVIVTGLIMVFASIATAEDIDIAVVNTQEVFEVHPAVQDAQQEVQAEQQQLMAEMEELDEDDEEEAAMMQQQLQEQLQALEQELMTEAMDEVQEDVEEIAETRGYDLVLDVNALLSGGEDITEAVVEEVGEPVEEEDVELDF